MLKRENVWVCLTSLLAAAYSIDAAPFNYGNLVVFQVGDETPVTNNNQPQPVVLKEFTLTPSSPAVQSVALPTTIDLPHRRLTIPRSAMRAGALTRSTDGHYLLLTGYDATPGVDPVPGVPLPYLSPASVVNRVVGRVDAFGGIDTSTALTDAYDGGEGIAGAASEDGVHLYLAGRSATSGSNAATGAVRYTTLGSTTSVRLGPGGTFPQTEWLRPRVVNIFTVGGVRSLYATFNYSGNRGVHLLQNNPDGTLQTAPDGVNPARVREIVINANQNSIYDFWFMDDETAYMCVDDPIPAGAGNNPGGVNKYKLEDGTWRFKYTLNAGLPTQTCTNDQGVTVYSQTVRALTGRINALGQAELYVITAEYDACQFQNQLMTVTDTGCPKDSTIGCTAADTFVNLQTAPDNTTFRGVEWAPRTCEGADCPGACCQAGLTCANTTQQACTGNGQWLGPDSTCENASCPHICPDPFTDADLDGDADVNDFAAFQKCYTGPFPTELPVSCRCFDRPEENLPDGDGDIDQADFAAFLACDGRADVPADPDCDGP